LLEHLSISF